VRLEGELIDGRELFWNASSGKRGTIVILVPRRAFDAEAIFRGGYEAFYFDNFRAGHTPSALRFARQQTEVEDVIAVCLPRNNGIEWMDIYVNPKRAAKLFEIAMARLRAQIGFQQFQDWSEKVAERFLLGLN
jgi:hypothetical protein